MPVNANAGEYKSVIGLDSLYIAEVTTDTAAAYVAGTPEYLAPAAEAAQAPNASIETQYMDNQPYDILRSRGETKISLEISGLPAEMQAKIIGAVFDSSIGRVQDNEGAPAEFALGFRSKKTNGSYRYYWFLKGSFEAPSEDAATSKDKPDVKTTKLIYTALKTIYKFTLFDASVDSLKRMFGDEDTDSFDATGWFSEVQTPETTSIAALALSSSVPTDPGTNIVVSADLSLTFNNALVASAVNGIGLYLVSDGSLVACAITLDTAKKVATINPNASLTAGVAYLLTYAVTDIYGQTLRGAVNLTTAAS